MANKELFEKYLQCPECKGSLIYIAEDKLVCSVCSCEFKVDDGIPVFLTNITDDLKLTIEKWNAIYDKDWQSGAVHTSLENYEKIYLPDIKRQIFEAYPFDKQKPIYLEIGSGTFFFGQKIAANCELIIGIDICINALKIAKQMLDSAGIKNYLLINGDILNMPIKENSVDLLFGGGVIEHFDNTQQSINENYRVLKSGGISFNSVPWLNIGSLTYRQVWGNIPDFPVLKQTAELVHTKILKGKHMIFGYEKSFTRGKQKKMHFLAGFTNVEISKFQVPLTFDFVPKPIRAFLIKIANKSTLLWPMMKIVATK